MKRIPLFFLLTILCIIAISGCTFQKKDVGLESRSGSEGLVISFLTSFPSEVVVGSNVEEIPFTLQVRNRGASPEGKDGALSGKMWLSGFDPNIVSISIPQRQDADAQLRDIVAQSPMGGSLEGRSSSNEEGGYAVYDYVATIDSEKLVEGKYSPQMIANICYAYETKASPTICISTDPYGLSSQKQVCKATDISLSSQGAPIAITKIEQMVLEAQKRMQFKITVKNVGKGEVFAQNTCSVNGPKALDKGLMDKVGVKSVRLRDIELSCRPLDNTNMRLNDGEGYVLCDADIASIIGSETSQYTLTTPLEITLRYDYKQFAQSKMQIRKLEEFPQGIE